MNHSLSTWFLEPSRSNGCLALARGASHRAARVAVLLPLLACALATTASAAPAAVVSPSPSAGNGSGRLADSVIAGILGGSARDAADAAFSTDNVDFAIRKGYVTKIGRMPPGIDSFTGDLGSTRCDAQVRTDGSIVTVGNCPGDKR